jgi:hypothetical protein
LHVAAFTTVGLVWSVKILAVKEWQEVKSEREKAGDNGDTQSWISCVVYVIAAMEERLFSEMAMALLVTLFFKNSMREGEGAYCRYATYCRCTSPLSLRLAWSGLSKSWP